jgi:hypothetical protein
MSSTEDRLEAKILELQRSLRDSLEYKVRILRLALTDITDGTAEAGALADPDPLKRAMNVIESMKLTAQQALKGTEVRKEGDASGGNHVSADASRTPSPRGRRGLSPADELRNR